MAVSSDGCSRSSAIPLGVTVRSLDPVAGAPAGAVSTLTVGALDDLDALRATVAGADVVTFEWEGVPAAPLRTLVAEGAVLRPSVDALEVSQDRVDEKTTFRALGIPVADFAPVDDADADLRDRRRRRSRHAGDPQDPARRLRRQGPGDDHDARRRARRRRRRCATADR